MKNLNVKKMETTIASLPIPFAEICFQEPKLDEVALYKIAKYKTNVPDRFNLKEVTQVKFMIDTGAGSNLISKPLFSPPEHCKLSDKIS